jgi:hypothetical protein
MRNESSRNTEAKMDKEPRVMANMGWCGSESALVRMQQTTIDNPESSILNPVEDHPRASSHFPKVAPPKEGDGDTRQDFLPLNSSCIRTSIFASASATQSSW